MLVKVIDEAHEQDLENSINEFLNTNIELIDIKYQVAFQTTKEEQLYCFSVLILYRK